MAARINEQQFEEKVLKADKPVLVDFYSDTCIPCKRMAGVLGEIEDDYDGKLDVFKINVNYEQGLAGKYEVRTMLPLCIQESTAKGCGSNL